MPLFNLQGGRVSGMDQNIFFTLIQQTYIFFLAAWPSNYLFHVFTYLFQLYLEGNYIFQHLAATNYLFYHLLASNYLFQKYPPLEIKWRPPKSADGTATAVTRAQRKISGQLDSVHAAAVADSHIQYLIYGLSGRVGKEDSSEVCPELSTD